MTTSRQTLAAKQRNNNYRPTNAPAAHVSTETRYINSQSPVIHSVDGYYVRSRKFENRYYRVTTDGQDHWATSATDVRVARYLVEQVLEYIG